MQRNTRKEEAAHERNMRYRDNLQQKAQREIKEAKASNLVFRKACELVVLTWENRDALPDERMDEVVSFIRKSLESAINRGL